MADEVTLTSLLNEAKQANNDVIEALNGNNLTMTDINDSIKEIDILIKEVLDSSVSDNEKRESRLELLNYKSSLLEIKSEIESQKQEMLKIRSDTNTIILTCEKAIQLNTGDIF